MSARLAALAAGSLLAGLAMAQTAAPAVAASGASTTTNNGPAVAPQAAVAAGSALPSSSGSAFSMLLGLAAVLALLAAIAWGLKRFGLTRPVAGNAAARIVGGVSVGTRERVMVIEVGDQWIVVGVAPGRVNALATLPRQEQVADQGGVAAGTPAFATWLRQTMDKRNGAGAPAPRQGNDGSTS